MLSIQETNHTINIASSFFQVKTKLIKHQQDHREFYMNIISDYTIKLRKFKDPTGPALIEIQYRRMRVSMTGV